MDVQDALLLQETEDETLTASSSSSSSSDQGWQKVTYPKRQRKEPPAKPAPSDPRADPRSTGPSSHVFASVEQKAQERRRALESAAALAASAEAAVTTRSKPAARHAFDTDEDDGSEAEAAVGKEEGGAGETKKVKQKKPKQPKVTVMEAASKIDADDLASFLVEVGESYESQPDILPPTPTINCLAAPGGRRTGGLRKQRRKGERVVLAHPSGGKRSALPSTHFAAGIAIGIEESR